MVEAREVETQGHAAAPGEQLDGAGHAPQCTSPSDRARGATRIAVGVPERNLNCSHANEAAGRRDVHLDGSVNLWTRFALCTTRLLACARPARRRAGPSAASFRYQTASTSG